MINSLRCGYSNAAELKRVIELLIMERVQFLTELHSFYLKNLAVSKKAVILHREKCTMYKDMHLAKCKLNKYVVRNDIEYAANQIIPLWAFGLMY